MDTTPANELLTIGIEVLATAIAILVAIYLPRIFKALEKRIGADIPDALEAEAMRLADRGIDRAEEFARKKGRELADKVPSSEKLDEAAAYFREHARPRVVKWLNGKVKDYLEERLGSRRAELERLELERGPVPDWVTDEGAGGDGQ